MSHRFFLEATPTGETTKLLGDEAHHAIHVMRFKIGDQISLFDGTGVEYRSIIQEMGKKQLLLRIVETIPDSRSLKTRITLAVALPKGDRQKFLIEKLVELGVDQLVPLKTKRSVAVANAKVIQRLKKQVIEASKQSGRNRLMVIAEEQSLPQLAERFETGKTANAHWIADPYEGHPIAAINSLRPAGVDSVMVAIGPEGGFDDSENALARQLGFQPVRLGPAILRVETAALAAAAILGIGSDVAEVV